MGFPCQHAAPVSVPEARELAEKGAGKNGLPQPITE